MIFRKRNLSAAFVTVLIMLITSLNYSCSKSGNDEETTPQPTNTLVSNLSYSPAVLELKSGIAGASVKPSKSGTTPVTYSLTTSPSSGGAITIDADGIIKASASLAIGDYKVSVVATNAAGSATFTDIYTIKVTANNTAPSGLVYSPSSITLTFGNAGTSATPTISSASTVTYTVSSSPTSSAITINSQGIISAAATLAVGTYQVSVTATNAIGSTTFTNIYSITVNSASTTSTFNNSFKALIQNNCGSCHGSSGPQTNYTNYTNAKNNIDEILRRINLAQGASGMMPRNGTKLSQATIDQFQKWKNDGLLEN